MFLVILFLVVWVACKLIFQHSVICRCGVINLTQGYGLLFKKRQTRSNQHGQGHLTSPRSRSLPLVALVRLQTVSGLALVASRCFLRFSTRNPGRNNRGAKEETEGETQLGLRIYESAWARLVPPVPPNSSNMR